MMPSFFENVFAFLFLHIHIIFSYTTGILFAWAVSLTIDFFHLSRLTQNTSQWIGFYKKEHILLLLISCMAGLIFSFFYTYKFIFSKILPIINPIAEQVSSDIPSPVISR